MFTKTRCIGMRSVLKFTKIFLFDHENVKRFGQTFLSQNNENHG